MWFWLMNAITLRSSSCSTIPTSVVTHDELVVVADFQNAIGVAVVDERALPRRERIREQDCHQGRVDGGLRLRRSSTGVLVKYPNC